MSSATFYKWRSRYGGMDASLVARLKGLEDENQRLKKRYGLRTPEGRDRHRGPGKTMVRPSQRREGALQAVQGQGVSVRLATAAFGISETYYRYQATLSAENAQIADWLIRLTHNQRNWGFGPCFLYLRNVQHFPWNHKRVYRIYRELALNLRTKPQPRLNREKPQPLAVP